MLTCYWSQTHIFTPKLVKDMGWETCPRAGDSFKGSKYAGNIYTITGVALYTREEIPHETIKLMGASLCLQKALKHKYHSDVVLAERSDIARMFRIYSQIGASLECWW